MKTTTCSIFYEQYANQQNVKVLFSSPSVCLTICSTVLDKLLQHMLCSSYLTLGSVLSPPKFWPAPHTSWHVQELVPGWRMTKDKCSICVVVSCTIRKSKISKKEKKIDLPHPLPTLAQNGVISNVYWQAVPVKMETESEPSGRRMFYFQI